MHSSSFILVPHRNHYTVLEMNWDTDSWTFSATYTKYQIILDICIRHFVPCKTLTLLLFEIDNSDYLQLWNIWWAAKTTATLQLLILDRPEKLNSFCPILKYFFFFFFPSLIAVVFKIGQLSNHFVLFKPWKTGSL